MIPSCRHRGINSTNRSRLAHTSSHGRQLRPSHGNGKDSPRLRRDAPPHLQTEGETVPALMKSQGPTSYAAQREDDRAGYSAWGSASLAQPT